MLKAIKKETAILGKIRNIYFDLERVKTLMEVLMADNLELKYVGEKRALLMENETGWAILMPFNIRPNCEVPYEIRNYEELN